MKKTKRLKFIIFCWATFLATSCQAQSADGGGDPTALHNTFEHPAQQDYVIGELKPGKYRVGFKAIHATDQARTYQGNPRPMQIAMWYPATSSGTRLKYEDYLFLDLYKEGFYNSTVEDKAQMRDDYINQTLFQSIGVANKKILKENLGLMTTAYINAEPIMEKFPLIIYSPREHRGVNVNTVLIEYLVSNGYVVITTPSRSPDAVSGVPTPETVTSNTADLQYIKDAALQMLPNLDKSKIATIGYGFGVVAAINLSLNNPDIQAVVSVGGAIENEKGIARFIQGIEPFKGRNVTASFLHLGSNRNGNPAKVKFIKDIEQNKVIVKFNHLNATAFSSHFILSWLKSADNPAKFNYADIYASYDKMCQVSHSFLDELFKDNEEDRYVMNLNDDKHLTIKK